MMNGASVAIAEDIVLDFSGLFTGDPPEKAPSVSPVEPLLEAGEYKTTSGEEKPVDGLRMGVARQSDKRRDLQAQRAREDHERSLEVYRRYQENTKKTELLQADIMKGVVAGADIYGLFLQAVKAVSLMTSNSLFYDQIEADLKAIYGRGLQRKPPLQMELQEAKTRLQRLLEAGEREKYTEDGDRINRAVIAHRKKITDLERMIAQTDKRAE